MNSARSMIYLTNAMREHQGTRLTLSKKIKPGYGGRRLVQRQGQRTSPLVQVFGRRRERTLHPRCGRRSKSDQVTKSRREVVPWRCRGVTVTLRHAYVLLCLDDALLVVCVGTWCSCRKSV